MATKTSKKATASTKSATQSKKATATVKKVVKKANVKSSVNSAKESVQKVKVSNISSSICTFFKKLDKAYYVAFLAIIGIILFFMPWLNISLLTNLYAKLHIDFLSGSYAIPQTLMSIFFTIDYLIDGLNGIVDKFATISDNLNSLQEVTQYINIVCGFLGVNVASNGEIVNNIIATIQSYLPTADQIVSAKQSLNSISGIAKSASLVTMLWVLLVVGFNAYAAIVCIVKKRITKGCTAAFIIEGIFVLLFMIICLVFNSVVQSIVFFLPNVIEASFWAWLTLIVCIIGVILCLKFKTK